MQLCFEMSLLQVDMIVKKPQSAKAEVDDQHRRDGEKKIDRKRNMIRQKSGTGEVSMGFGPSHPLKVGSQQESDKQRDSGKMKHKPFQFFSVHRPRKPSIGQDNRQINRRDMYKE